MTASGGVGRASTAGNPVSFWWWSGACAGREGAGQDLGLGAGVDGRVGVGDRRLRFARIEAGVGGAGLPAGADGGGQGGQVCGGIGIVAVGPREFIFGLPGAGPEDVAGV